MPTELVACQKCGKPRRFSTKQGRQRNPLCRNCRRPSKKASGFPKSIICTKCGSERIFKDARGYAKISGLCKACQASVNNDSRKAGKRRYYKEKKSLPEKDYGSTKIVYETKNVFCPHYNECLDEACKKNIPFGCQYCPGRHKHQEMCSDPWINIESGEYPVNRSAVRNVGGVEL